MVMEACCPWDLADTLKRNQLEKGVTFPLEKVMSLNLTICGFSQGFPLNIISHNSFFLKNTMQEVFLVALETKLNFL